MAFSLLDPISTEKHREGRRKESSSKTDQLGRKEQQCNNPQLALALRDPSK